MRTHPIVTALTAMVLAVAAGGAAAAGDPKRGKALAEPCMGCHGIPSYTNAYPTYHVPKLAGQHAEYLVAALQAYKRGDRNHKTMQAQATSLSDQDMADIAAFFSTHP